MSKFKIGDRVVCIDAKKAKYCNITKGFIGPDLVYKREYLIYGIHQCTCGSFTYDVGLTLKGKFENIECTSCDRINHSGVGGVHWCRETRFEKAIEASNKESEFIQMTFTAKELIKQPISVN